MTFMATLYIKRADDGTLTLTWPEWYGPVTQMSRDVLFDIVEQLNDHNTAIRLLDDLHEDTDCRFDHAGDCQEHGWFGLDGDECPNATARRLVAKRKPEAP